MDTKTLDRVESDFNSNSYFPQTSSQQQDTNKWDSSLTQKTQSLSIISINNAQIQVSEIIAFYNQMDRNLFDDKLNFQFIYSEKNCYNNINEIVNQRLILGKTNSSTIIAGLKLNNFKLIAIKLYKFGSYEHAIYKLEEYRIHHKINKFFPDKSLQLITPVEIKKNKQNYSIAACLERGECNLYDYSRKFKISLLEAYSIFKEILIQLANLHSLNIAHRDVKPQNIFYVKNKGWILSDFGESQEYDQVESIYSLRGTPYFLMPQLKQYISKTKFIQQNLLANDLYALGISFIVIQNFQYIQDIHDLIINTKDLQLQKLLLITNYQQFLSYVQNFNTQDIQIQFNEDYLKFNIPLDQRDESVYIQSFMHIYRYNQKFNIDPQLLVQLEQLIQNKLKNIKNISPQGFKFLKSDVRLQNPRLRLKAISKQSVDWQVFNLDSIFTFGYSETIIFYCQQLLSQSYNQNIHLKLINSLYRVEMFEEANQQLQLFDQYLNFDQLDTVLKQNYLFIKSYENQKYKQNNINQICFQEQLQDYKIQDEFQMHIFLSQKLDEIENQQLYSFDNLLQYLQKQLSQFDPANINILEQLMSLIKDNPIDIHEKLVLNIYEQQNQSVDLNYKSELLCDLGRIFILQNKQKQIKEIHQRQKQLLFNAESLQQLISFQIQIKQLKLFHFQVQRQFNLKQFNKTINNLKVQIQKINNVKFPVYKKYILANLLIFIENLIFFLIQKVKILNYYLLFIIPQNMLQRIKIIKLQKINFHIITNILNLFLLN